MFQFSEGNIPVVVSGPTPRCVLLSIALVLAGPVWAVAQFNPLFPNEVSDQADPVVSHLRRLPRDPLAASSFNRAQKAIEDGDAAGGLEALQQLIENSIDFFQVEGLQLSGSFHHDVEAEIRKHLEDYERLYGVQAQQMLDEAIASSDMHKLEALVRRFRLTQAGQRGHRMLVQFAIDSGNLGSGLHGLMSDLRIAMEDGRATADVQAELNQTAKLLSSVENQQLLDRLLSDAESSLKVKPETIRTTLPGPLYSSEGVSSIYDWIVPRGSVTHSGNSEFSPAMFSDAWQRALVDEYDFFLGDIEKEQAKLKETQKFARQTETKIWSQHDRSAFPTGQPLIVGDRVIVPGYATLKSYNLNTGEVDGVGVNIDQTFEYLHEYTSGPGLEADPFREEVRELFFALRGWRDLTSASVSSDGKYVYAISSCQLVGSVDPEYLSRSTQRHELLPQAFNQLHAFELDAGLRIRWSVGTIDESAIIPFDPEQKLNREIFFYGAPLPVNDRLFVLGEERGQIQLYELDRETGGVLWSVGLLNPDQDIVRDPARRLAGLMPTFSQGLLVCPTGEGVVTAVDPISRQVVWSHQYGETRQMMTNRFIFRRGIRNRKQTVRQSIETYLGDDRWFDSRVVSAGNYVLHTPPDSDELVCLNTQDGSRVWDDEFFRLRSLYLAGLYDDSFLLVGRSEISLLRLDDATRVWSCPIPRPSGRGLCMGDHFLQPLMTGEVAIIDLKLGRQVARSPMPGDRVVGNLTAAHGRLIAQAGTNLIAFKSLSEIEEMLATTDDQKIEEALRGELFLHQGDRAAGLEKLDAVPVESLPDRSRTVLVWSLLDGLKHEFTSFQAKASKVESLLKTDEQRFLFLKSHAQGLSVTGDQVGAFESYLKLFESLSEETALRETDGVLELLDQRWVFAQLQQIFQSADDQQQQQFQEHLDRWVTTSKNDRAVVTFLKSFDLQKFNQSHVIDRLKSMQARPEIAGGISAVYGKLVEKSQSPEVSAAALRELAAQCLNFKDGNAATEYLRHLAERKVIPAGSDQTASTVAQEIRQSDNWTELFNSVPVWPGTVKVAEKVSPFSKSTRNQIPLFGPDSVPLKGWTFFVNPMGSHIDIYDQHGRRQCQLSTGILSTRFPIGSTLARYVSVRGHLALIVLADRFMLVDFQQRKDLPRIIMNQFLITEDQNPYGTDSFVSSDQRPEPGFRTFRSMTPVGSPAGNVGTLGASVLCFTWGSQLVAIDPDSGQILWQRHDVELGSEIFNDDEFVLTMAPQTRKLRLFNAVDGTDLGEREFPKDAIDSILSRENGDWGRLFPVVEKSEQGTTFSMFDPVRQENVWTFQSPLGTTWTTVDGQHLAFLTPEKNLTILNGLTGEVILEKSIPVAERVRSLTVLTYPGQWIVLPGAGPPLDYDFSYPSLITRTIEKTVQGTVVAIDQQTHDVVWTHDVENQKIATQVPTAWPILFMGKSSGQNVRSLVINRLNGEVVVDEELEYDQTWIHWQASIQPMQIIIGYGRKTVNLDCVEETPGASKPAANSE